MPDLLLELHSEEIPARMQRKAGEDLRRLITDALVARGMLYEGAKALWGPRRLALHVAGLPVRGADQREERKGPRVGAPEAAIAGFLKSAGLVSLDQATIQTDSKKGAFYVAILEKPGQSTLDALAQIIPATIRGFPWPKSMRSGAASIASDSLRWVRPLRSILATFGPETEEPEIVAFEIDGLRAGDVTFGHRVMGPAGPIRVRRLDDYLAALDRAKVISDVETRKDIIAHDARNLAFAAGLEWVEDEGLLEEVAGLVEWPVVLMGSFDPAFLAAPPEAIRATIRANQKCFVLRGPDGRLANRFLMVANLEATDGGKAIVAGNERVVRARLSDARYFFETDQKSLPDVAMIASAAAAFGLDMAKPLDQRMARLAHLNVVFHDKLGSQGERVARIAALARELAPLVGADPALAARAAVLAKADLTTEMVGEFPELQGLMGARYATLQGEHPSVCAAIEDHYKPQGPADRVPSDPVTIAVALADKLDVLVGFWAVDEKPTGSKDPYALRRAALGVIRLVVENSITLALLPQLQEAALSPLARVEPLAGELGYRSHYARFQRPAPITPDEAAQWDRLDRQVRLIAADLLVFFHDRLKVMLRERGARHDLVDAVLASDGDQAQDDLLLIVRRVEALSAFLATEDGSHLLAGYRRAASILAIEEKRDGHAYDLPVDMALIAARGGPQEAALAHTLVQQTAIAGQRVAADDHAGAMTALATLRPAVDAFFEAVLVNDADPTLRDNRLRLLSSLRAATRTVADFGRIVG